MTEPTPYRQDILLGLQRAWLHLCEAVNVLEKNNIKTAFLHHLSDCLCWDSVQDMQVMEKTLAILTRLAAKHQVKGQVSYWIERLRTLLNELLLTLGPDRMK